MKYCYNNSPYYRDILKQKKINPTNIKSFEDFEKIPFTNPSDLRNPKQFFSVPESQFTKVFSSSGTTGKPKQMYYTKNDLEKQISRNATGMHLMHGLNEDDRVRITYDFGYGPRDWGIRFCMEQAVYRIGALAIVTGNRLPPDQELELLKTYKISIIMGTTSYIYNLTWEIEKLYDLHSLKLKNILIGSEPLPRAVRKKIESSWNTKAYQGYGLAELGTSIAGECIAQDGMHVSESDYYVEIIDPKTGEHLDDGELGEITITTLDREGMPILRYRTHDLGLIIPENCPCGLPFKRIKIKGRTDKMVPIGSGDNLHPDETDDMILGIPSVIDYQLVVEKKNNFDQITAIVETKKVSEKTKQTVVDAILKIPSVKDGVCNSHTIASPIVKLVKPNTIDKSRRKAKRIIDKRHLYDE
jgi:phenylacetate-CoA ligase